MPEAAIISDFWNDQLVEHDRQYVFLVLLGLLASFSFIRTSTRLMRSPRVPWWPGSVVSDGGVHVHHLVFGILLMIIAGTLGFAGFTTDFLLGVCAVAFGVGVGLTIDEFALWVYLDDVYWSEQGRSSVDAAVIAVTGMALVILGVRPFEVETGSAAAVAGTLLGAALAVGAVVVCFLKGRVMHGAVGFFVGPLALYGALRLGKPTSPWARKRYGDRNPRKQRRAEERFRPDRRTERLKERLRDLIGGVTEEEYRRRLAGRRDD